MPAKKAKTESVRKGEVTAAEAAQKLAGYLSDGRKYEKSVGLLRRLVEEKGQELPTELLVTILTAIARNPLLHYQGREDSTRLFTLLSARVTHCPHLSLWSFLFSKVNPVFTDDSLVFSARVNELLQSLEREGEGQEKDWWEGTVRAVQAIAIQVQKPWARVPVAKLIDFCVRNMDKLAEDYQGKVTEMATNMARDRLKADSASETAIRAPLEAGHRVVDGREEVSTVNSSEAWSTTQSGL